ncbi:uncharacterized protein LOC110711464 [Chenopodium quinoa]|uniref:uncharacterized protein LOC110711464 n=1 Tax=Chenopodium quinoa TaxID=63459 RepID=UPI000B772198|nr:uncharacterized protein LOC110711464 [Chenopodium quinoa]
MVIKISWELRGINQVYIIGGDGTQKGALVIYQEVRKRGLKVSVMRILRTIDNDITVYIPYSFSILSLASFQNNSAGVLVKLLILMMVFAMDSSVATDPNNDKDYTDVYLERTMSNQLFAHLEVAADVGSSGAAVDVGSVGPAADVGSTGPAADVGSARPVVDVGSSEVVVVEEKLSEKKQIRIKLVGTKGKGKKVEKGLKEKQKIKLEETKSSNEGEDLKSHVYGTLHSWMSPSSIVQVIEKCLKNQLKAIRAIGFGSMEFLKR